MDGSIEGRNKEARWAAGGGTNERTNEPTNERTKERNNERTNERTNERMVGRTDGRTDEKVKMSRNGGIAWWFYTGTITTA